MRVVDNSGQCTIHRAILYKEVTGDYISQTSWYIDDLLTGIQCDTYFAVLEKQQ